MIEREVPLETQNQVSFITEKIEIVNMYFFFVIEVHFRSCICAETTLQRYIEFRIDNMHFRSKLQLFLALSVRRKKSCSRHTSSDFTAVSLLCHRPFGCERSH